MAEERGRMTAGSPAAPLEGVPCSGSPRRGPAAPRTPSASSAPTPAAELRAAPPLHDASGERPSVSLYVHVPFCTSKCAYCDFYSGLTIEDAAAEAFCDGVLRAVEAWRARGLLSDVPSVYFGGGTPTVLGARLPGLVEGVLGRVGMQTGAEVTVEGNPDSVDAGLVAALADAGVTRISLGVQSFDDAVLARLGRCHTAQDAVEASVVLRNAGMPFSLDLICGVPGLDNATWRDSLQRAIEVGAGHLSVYPLTIEPDTALAVQVDAGTLREPDDDTAAEQMLTATEVLRAAGFERYEIASHARPGQRARHNVGYWTAVPYIGIGPSAASMLPAALVSRVGDELLQGCEGCDDSAARVRFVPHDSLDAFVADPSAEHAPSAELECITAEESVREDAMLGMRLSEGISEELAARAGVTMVLAELREARLVECVAGSWRLTERGWLLGNEVFEALWTAGADDSA